MKLRAFTLIELLVVMAIIGTLSSIVLSSLSSARSKGRDATAIADLNEARTQAQLFYAANGEVYTTAAGGAMDVCSPLSATGSATSGVKGIYPMIQDAAQQTGTVARMNARGDANTTICNSATPLPNMSTWAAQVPLSTGKFFCVDYMGAATTTDSTALTSQYDWTC